MSNAIIIIIIINLQVIKVTVSVKKTDLGDGQLEAV